MDLGKRPGLLVVGRDVDEELGFKINFETSYLPYFCVNSAEERDAIYKALGIKDCTSFDYLDQWAEDHGCSLYVRFLANQNFFSSSENGGHGWVSLDGKVGCNSFNIGPWPQLGNIEAEWKLIAMKYPELELQSQLLDGECCDCDKRALKPLVQFNISNGKVKTILEPKTLICQPYPRNYGKHSEIFVDLAKLKTYRKGVERKYYQAFIVVDYAPKKEGIGIDYFYESSVSEDCKTITYQLDFDFDFSSYPYLKCLEELQYAIDYDVLHKAGLKIHSISIAAQKSNYGD